MRIRLRFFASLREALGESAERDAARGTTVAELWQALVAGHASLAALPVRFAVNETYVDDAYVVRDGDDIAVFPPVSGG